MKFFNNSEIETDMDDIEIVQHYHMMFFSAYSLSCIFRHSTACLHQLFQVTGDFYLCKFFFLLWINNEMANSHPRLVKADLTPNTEVFCVE